MPGDTLSDNTNLERQKAKRGEWKKRETELIESLFFLNYIEHTQ